MPAPEISPTIQTLIDKGLFDRLPATFSTFFLQQFQDWRLLFPAERDYHERLCTLLDKSDAEAVAALFTPLQELETRMGINSSTWSRRTFSLDQVEFLQRSPHYQEWRRAIAAIFAKLDPILNAEVARKGRPRLIVFTAPADLPADPNRTWLRLQSRGKRIPLDLPESGDYFSQTLAGGANSCITSLAAKEPYKAWAISGGKPIAGAPGVVTLSYDDLKTYRLRLMEEVRRMVESGEVRAPQQLAERLKDLKLLANEGDFSKDEILAEFVRAVLLNGNGTLLINNTFVEWTAIQAARRARPDVMVISFGIRNKLKPFSSLLVHADQDTANPIPTQMDTLGTYVDLEIFYQYLWQEFEKYPEYRNNTAYLFLGEDMDQLFCIAPPDFPLLTAKSPQKLTQVFAAAKSWLNL